MSYVGNTPADKFLTLEKQQFSVSATTNYTLSHSVSSPQDIRLVINNVPQNPNSSYTVNGTALTLSSATSSGDTMYCVFLGKAIGTVGVPVNGVGTSQLSDDAVTSSKIADSVKLGKINQTVQTTVTEASFTSGSTTFTTITGLTVAITPSATSSKVLVDFDICGGVDNYNGVTAFRLMRDSTPIYIADSATNYTQSTHGGLRGSLDDNSGFLVNIKYMDSPSTASQVVYSVQVRSEASSYTYKLNRMGNDTSGQGYSFRSASNVIAQEVLA